jgi:hypothetical protein
MDFKVEQARDLAISTNNVERMRITSAGNVGIGTSTPATGYKLDVAGDIIKSSSFGGTAMYNSISSYECSVVLHPLGAMTFKCSSSGVITSFATISMDYSPGVSSDLLSPFITPVNQFDMWRWVVNLTAGTYLFRMFYGANVDRGAAHLYVDNTFQIAYDGYSSSGNRVQTGTSVTINNTGTHKIELRMDSKHASSTNYYFLFYCAGMLRTN